MPDSLLADLDDSQRAAITSTAAPLAILAPAGSGKTRVLTRRIAWRIHDGSAQARHVVAVTFTRKAAAELRTRLVALGTEPVVAGTFHALALDQLRRTAVDRGRYPPTVLDRKARLLGPLLGRHSDAATVSELAAEIEWAKAQVLGPADYAAAAPRARRHTTLPAEQIAARFADYEQEKRRRGLLDFDDLLVGAAEAMADADAAAAQRFRFRHFFVDEFQDASPLQLRVLRAWLGSRSDLCVVGDEAQAIYGFAGGDAGALVGFTELFPGATVLRLSTNYRSTRQIVRASQAALGAARHDVHPVTTPRGDGPIPRVVGYPDGEAEADGVARAARAAATRGRRWSDIAVVFRTNAQAAPIAAALARNGVPHRLRDADRGGPSAPVREALRRLRDHQRDRPDRSFAELLAELVTPDDHAPPPPSELVDLARDYTAVEPAGGSLAGFVSWLELGTTEATHGLDAVELVTFHRAKGLEWPVVFVVGLEAGFVPIAHAETHDALAEEARLLHVALGRASEELHLSWARRRTFGTRPSAREESPWLARVAGATMPGPADRLPDPHHALSAVRSTLAAHAPAPPPRRRRFPR